MNRLVVLGISILLVLSLDMTTLARSSSDNVVTDGPNIILGTDHASANNDQKVIVKFRGMPGLNERSLVRAHGGKINRDFPQLNAFAVEMPAAKVKELSHNPNVLYVEEDQVRYALGLADSELEPALTNGLYGLVTTGATAVHSSSVTGAGVNVCFADTAIDETHPDIAPNFISTDNFNSQPIDLQSETHGTHVGGTIAGALNNKGVKGMAYGAKLINARVLGPNGAGTVTEIMAGVTDLVNNHSCRIVSLSLGGTTSSQTEKDFYDGLYNNGVLVVAAAGNNGQSGLTYPANYPSVLAVGAVDNNNNIASFSSIGNNLDISAPGVRVLSSVPIGTGWDSSVTTGQKFFAVGIQYAGTTNGITGTLNDCGYGGPGECPLGVSGNIALIQRGGSLSLADKLTNAKNQGAVAAVIYNDQIDDIQPTLGYPGSYIPAVFVSNTAGATLKSQAGSSATVVNLISDWNYYSGTSMAAPHVAGAVALIWSVNPGLTNVQVESILKDTDTDLGVEGFDPTFGYGLINVESAVNVARSNTNPPSNDIPEFPTIVIPVVSVIGLMFIFGRRR